MLLLLTPTLEVQSLSIHYLISMPVKFAQNRMEENVYNFELLGKKWLTNFEKVLTSF